MKKVLALILALVLALSLAACGEPLVLYMDTLYSSPDGNGIGLIGLVNCEASGVNANDLSATSSDESIVVIKDEIVNVLGSKLGEADITVKAGFKTGIVHVSVLDYPECLQALAEQEEKKDKDDRGLGQDYIDEYSIYCGIIKDLDSFKDPSSVQIADDEYWYNDAHNNFIIQLRGKNSFGGYTSSYFSVNKQGADQIDLYWREFGSHEYNGETYYRTPIYKLTKALETYISRTY